jgi:hypothetical protein
MYEIFINVNSRNLLHTIGIYKKTNNKIVHSHLQTG